MNIRGANLLIKPVFYSIEEKAGKSNAYVKLFLAFIDIFRLYS